MERTENGARAAIERANEANRMTATRLVDQAAQKSRFRCFVLASLRTSREALLYIWGVPMFVMFINYKHYNHWHTPNVK